MAKKILVVDDDEGILDAVAFFLEECGYVVKAISDGTLTCSVVAEFQPDLILLDVLLSGVDGRDVCRELKDNRRYRHIPIIMISAHPTAKAETKQYGAQEFLAKPFDTEDMLRTVEEYIS